MGVSVMMNDDPILPKGRSTKRDQQLANYLRLSVEIW
jgi:hypothetical protein